MKKHICLLLLFSMVFGLSYGQIAEHKPMGSLSYYFYQKKIERQKTDKRRSNIAERKLERKYISANQVYKTLDYFDTDDYKLVYAKTTFDKLSDKSNSLRICDAIKKQSHYALLWNYIKEECIKYSIDPTNLNSYTEYLKLRDKQKDKQYDTQSDYYNYSKVTEVIEKEEESSQSQADDDNISDNVEKVEQPEENSSDTVNSNKSKITFPEFENYTGEKNCKTLMSEKEFYAFANAIVKISSDEEKSKIGIEYAQKYCFPTQYVMKISIFIKDENFRYSYLKSVYEYIYDKENFHYASQLITNQERKEEIEKLK